MAKKRKKDKEPKEEYEFKPPEFDEKEFLLKELRDTKTVLFTVGYAALFGIIAGLLSIVSESLVPIGAVLLFGGLFSLKYFYGIIKVDVSQFLKKNWAGNVAWFFFTFLAVWVLTFNYPVSDHANPTVTDVTVWVDSGTNITAIDYEYVDSLGTYAWVPRWGESLDSIIHASASYSVNISAKVADNGELSTVRIKVGGGDDFVTMSPEGNHRYGRTVTGSDLTAGSYLTFEIMASDAVDHVTTFSPVSGILVVA